MLCFGGFWALFASHEERETQRGAVLPEISFAISLPGDCIAA